MNTIQEYTRQDIEKMAPADRPRVKCTIDAMDIDEDGTKSPYYDHSFLSTIVVDGNNPWLCGMSAGDHIAFRVSWGLLLESLNDRFARPIHFGGGQCVEYEI